MRRSPAAWACTKCARNSTIWRSANSIRRLIGWSATRLDALADRNKHLIAEIEQQLTKKLADRGIAARVAGPAQARLFDLAQDGAQVGRLRATVRYFRLPRHRQDGRRLLPGARHRAHDLAGGAGPLQGLHLDAEANDYRSIHTTVIGPGKQRVELQIRTTEMHEIAEYGIAAHALYKDGVGSPTEMLSRELSAYAWLRRTIELLAEGSNPEEFLEHTKLELFHDQVFCFTPEGQADRAAAQGDADRFRLCGAHRRRQHARSAARSTARSRRWRRRSSMATKSRSSPRRRKRRRRRPGNRSSSPARRAPRSGAPRAAAVRTQYAGLGRRIVERLFQRAKIAYSDEKLTGALPRLARASIEDVMAAVGRSELKASDVARAMYPDYKEERAAAMAVKPKSESGWFGLQEAHLGQIQGAGRERERPGDPDPRHQRRSAGALCAGRRRGAGRPHRRHSHAGRGDHHLSDPVACLERIRGQAGTLARRALGRGREHAAALPGAHRRCSRSTSPARSRRSRR